MNISSARKMGIIKRRGHYPMQFGQAGYFQLSPLSLEFITDN
jgi:hypothetical protein